MKKIAVGIVVALGLTFLQAVPAKATGQSIVIIDTAIDTSVVKVAHEVCLMEELRCPNGRAFMEGAGAAHMPASNGFEHGTRMVQVAQQINPNMNIVFIRIFPADRRGNVARNAANVNSTVRQALEWVVANKTKFNIVAVSASVGETRFSSGSSYCPVNVGVRNAIINLQNLGVGTVFAAGNRFDYNRVDYPACVSEAIAISSAGINGNVERYSNRGIETDFFVLGTVAGSTGTSAATAAFSAYWAKNYRGTYQATYDYLKSITKTASTVGYTTNLFVDITK